MPADSLAGSHADAPGTPVALGTPGAPGAPGVPGVPDAERRLSIDDLDRAIVTAAARLNEATHDFLGRAGLPIETVRRLSCDSDRVILIENAEGEPLSIGRKSRVVSAAIRRALYARDKHCQFPGCRRTRFLHSHHLEHWSLGGVTSLAGLMLLCGTHHRLLHEGGFRIDQDYRGHWFFRSPDGRAIPPCGYRPEDTTDDGGAVEEYLDADASAEACPPVDDSAVVGASAEACLPVEAAAAEVGASAEARMVPDISAEVGAPAEAYPPASPSSEAWMVRDTSAEARMIRDASAKAFPAARLSAEAWMVRGASAEELRTT